jgi:hypothetical protein
MGASVQKVPMTWLQPRPSPWKSYPQQLSTVWKNYTGVTSHKKDQTLRVRSGHDRGKGIGLEVIHMILWNLGNAEVLSRLA